MAYILRKTDQQILIADGAKVSADVTLAPGVNVWYNAVIRGDDGAIAIGADTNIQDCAVVHEHATIGARCTIGHSAIIHGCTIGDDCLIGMGAIVLNGAIIGDHCMVAAGALVPGKVNAPAGSMIMGSPAKVVRPLSQEELDYMADNQQLYLRLAQQFRAGGAPE